MVVLNRIYTRTGDAGETALGDGSRVPKHAPRVEAYGTVDEVNATLGLARLHAAGEPDASLARVQNDLFDLGADLATPDFENDGRPPAPGCGSSPAQVARLEAEIDAMNARLARCAASCCPAARARRAPAPRAAPSPAVPSGWRSALAGSSRSTPRRCAT